MPLRLSNGALALAWILALAATPLNAQPAPPVKPQPPQAAAPPSAPQPPVQARAGGPESLDPASEQTVDVVKGTRLVLSNSAGEVTVRAWDRDVVRVQSTRGMRERVELQTTDNTLRVRVRTTTRNRAGLVDFTITVPRWMAVNLSGTYLTASVEGTAAEVDIETVSGDVTLKGGSGTVNLRSIEGEIRVDDAAGKVQVSTVNNSIAITGVSGDVVADTVNGDVTIASSKAASVEVSTVNGDVRFEGSTSERGTYRITTHNGDIRVGLGAQANATVFVRTYGGDFTSDFPVTLPEGMSQRQGNKRFNFTLGAGSARVELQSFQGDIHVAKGALRRAAPDRKEQQHMDALGRLEFEVRRDVERELERELDRAFRRSVAPRPPAADRPPRQ